MVHNKATRHV